MNAVEDTSVENSESAVRIRRRQIIGEIMVKGGVTMKKHEVIKRCFLRITIVLVLVQMLR